jgi:hypothetical protein
MHHIELNSSNLRRRMRTLSAAGIPVCGFCRKHLFRIERITVVGGERARVLFCIGCGAIQSMQCSCARQDE